VSAGERARAERALLELEALRHLRGRRRRPTRYHARAVMIPLGLLILAEGEAAVRPLLRRLAAAVEPERASWEAAVAEELSLACAEHVHGADPRYLGHQSFDLEYLVAARERLEARLVAARALDLWPSEALLCAVAEADARVAPFLRAGGRSSEPG